MRDTGGAAWARAATAMRRGLAVEALEPASGPWVRCRLAGRVVAGQKERLSGIAGLVDDYPGIHLDLDLSEVEELDLWGVVFLHRTKAAVIGRGGRITMHGLPPGVDRVLRQCGMDRVLLGTFEGRAGEPWMGCS